MTDLNVPNDRDEASPEPPGTPGPPNDPVEPSRPADPSAGSGASASGDGPSSSKTPPPRVPPSGADAEPGETSIDPPPTSMPGGSAGDEGTSSEGDWWVRSGGGPSWGRQRGQRIAGYELVDRIDKDANNAFGEVWLARRLDPFQRVAIKFLRPDRVREDLVRRFQGEAKALARFNHPYIARFYELGRDGDTPYLVMQYVPGDQVTRYCDARGLSIERRLELMAKLCDAVQHVHLQGLVHRDLKPGNILVSETGPGERSADDAEADGGPIPVLIDFGLAKSTNPDNPLTSGMPDGVGRGLFGTYSYASPEQIRATRDEDTGREADIYALGAVLFELLVGVSPMQHVLEDESLGDPERAMRLAHDDRPTMIWAFDRLPAQRRAAIASARGTTEAGLRRALRSRLRHLTEHALRSDPHRRFSDARAMGRDIDHYLCDRDYLEAAAEPAASRLLRHVRRHRLPYAAAALVFVALVAGLITTFWQWREAERARELSEAVIRFIAEDVLEPEGIELHQNVTLAEVLDEGAATTEDDDVIAGRPEVQARLQQILGGAQLAIGKPEQAIPLLEQSIELHRMNREIGTVESRIELLQDLADAIRQLAHDCERSAPAPDLGRMGELLEESRRLIASTTAAPSLQARQALFEGNFYKAVRRLDEAAEAYGRAEGISRTESSRPTIGVTAAYNRCLVAVDQALAEKDAHRRRTLLQEAEACLSRIMDDRIASGIFRERAAPGRPHPIETMLLTETARVILRIDIVEDELEIRSEERAGRLGQVARLFESGPLASTYYEGSWRERELRMDEGTLCLRRSLASDDDQDRDELLRRGLDLYLAAHREQFDLEGRPERVTCSRRSGTLRRSMAKWLAWHRTQVPTRSWVVVEETDGIDTPLFEQLPLSMAPPSRSGRIGVLVLPKDDLDLDVSAYGSNGEELVADRSEARYAFVMLESGTSPAELRVESKGVRVEDRPTSFWMVMVQPAPEPSIMP